MRRPSPVLRIAAAALAVAWLAVPATGFAADEEAAADAENTPPAADEAAATDAESTPPATDEAAKTDAENLPPPVDAHWYDTLEHNTDIGVDLLIVRPLAFVTLAAGAALLVPAAFMTAPNGWDSVKEAYQRFVGEPGEYFYSRPLGEF
jgi:hypothetical protein